ncbi:MAG TPA: lipoprotein-releasing ABC transporter permease subunit [Stellaceae bacterium]|nr:lipoprotein-releasing ABC transporter permease subunit [Stellaceae bacterium]
MIFGGFERMVAFRYLRARRQEGFVSVIAVFSLLGIGLGVATLIVVMAVMNGFRLQFVSNIIGVDGHLTVHAAGGAVLTGFEDLDAKIRQVPGVVAVRPLVEGKVLATAPRASTGVSVRGLRAEDIASQPLLANGIGQPALDQFSDDSVIVGWRLLQSLGLRVGDSVTLVSPNGTVTAFGSVPRIKAYRVVGMLNVGMAQYDSSLVLMPLAAAQLFFRTGQGVSALEVFASDPDHLEAQRRAIAAIVGEGARIEDWQQSNAVFMNAITVERNVMFLILALIILIAAFNIVSGMIMFVQDKGGDIAILRTMGASRAMVLRIFVLSGASIGFLGTLAGFAVGVAFATHIPAIRTFLETDLRLDIFNAELDFFTRIPAQVYVSDVVSVVAMAFGLSFLATLYPSWRAARLDPVEALRYE